jgi:hypothetical protein
MVNMITDGAVGVSDAVGVTEQFCHARSVKVPLKSSTPKIRFSLDHNLNRLFFGGGDQDYGRDYTPQKSLLHDWLLRLCWQYELAAVSFLGHCVGRRGDVCVAQFRQKIRRLRLQERLLTRA